MLLVRNEGSVEYLCLIAVMRRNVSRSNTFKTVSLLQQRLSPPLFGVFFSPVEFQKHCECEEAVPDMYNQYLNRGGITSVASMMHSLCDLIILLFVVKASLIHISSLFQELIKRQFQFPEMIMITVLGKCLSDSLPPSVPSTPTLPAACFFLRFRFIILRHSTVTLQQTTDYKQMSKSDFIYVY